VNLTLARFGVVALGLILAWRIVQVNAVLYDDSGRPRLPTAPAAAPGSGAPEREMLLGVLRENPAQAAALLMLAREHEKESRGDEARRAYQLAYQLAPLDREVLGAAAAFYLRRGEVAAALLVLDRLVENFPETRERAFPVLAEVLGSRQHAQAWNAVVARAPEWLGPFIVATCRRAADPSLLVPLFLKRVVAGKAAPAETACLVDGLRAAGRFEEAYQVWLNTLPRERLADVGYVFNGNFEYHPSGVGFDWMLPKQPEREVGHVTDLAPASGAVGKRALRASYNGKRQSGSAAAQYLALAPGRYVLGGFARPHAMTVGRGVQWTLRCVNGGKPRAAIAASERFTGSSEWRRFVFDIEVPADCRGQVLQLEPAGADDGPAFVGGTVWFDDLLLRRRR
jgi:hypothetical protein